MGGVRDLPPPATSRTEQVSHGGAGDPSASGDYNHNAKRQRVQ